MQFLDATTDFAFKKLFGDKKHPELTISFLNSILGRQEGHLITKVTINNNENLPFIKDAKKSILDINCTDQTGKEYIVEVQRQNEGDFLERAQFYSGYCLTRQLPDGGKYNELRPVIFIGVVTKFNVFENHDRYLTHHVITDTESGERNLQLIEYHFVELKKFTKSIEEAEKNIADQWIYLLKHAHKLHEIPQQLESNDEIVEAMYLLERARLSNREFEAYLADLEASSREEKIKQTAIAQGLAEGKAQGLAEGKAEGKAEAVAEIAKTLLTSGMTIDQVAKVTGLTVADVKKIS
jgi:predicted transposase/invertase (TIGR01784 family)